MTSLFSIFAATTAPASQAASRAATQPAFESIAAGERFVLGVLAAGACVLVVWLIRRLAYPEKLLLRDAPGRPNGLGILHVVLIAGWVGLNILTAYKASESEPRAFTLDLLVVSYAVSGVVWVVALAMAHVGFRHGIVRGMGLSLRRPISDTVRGIIGGLAVLPVCYFLGFVGERIVPEIYRYPHVLLEFLRSDPPVLETFLAFNLAFLAAPLVEETLYRGILQTALRRLTGRPWVGILLASVIFTVAHLSLRGEPTRVVGLEVFAPIFLLSLVLGYNYERTGRLWASIVIHMIFNGVNLVGALLGAP